MKARVRLTLVPLYILPSCSPVEFRAGAIKAVEVGVMSGRLDRPIHHTQECMPTAHRPMESRAVKSRNLRPFGVGVFEILVAKDTAKS